MQQLVEYCKQQAGKIHSLARKRKQDFDSEDLHQLRVAIKKIRAVCVLADLDTRDHYLHRSKQLFGPAGKLREIQLELDHLKRTSATNMPALKARLEKELQSNRQAFFQLRNKLSGQLPMVPGRAVKLLREVKKQDVKHYLSEETRKLTRKAGARKLGNKQLHALRKGIKRLFYIQKAADLPARKKLLKKAEILSALLGKWHDLRILSQQLKTALHLYQISGAERKHIGHLLHNIKLETSRERSKLKKELRQL